MAQMLDAALKNEDTLPPPKSACPDLGVRGKKSSVPKLARLRHRPDLCCNGGSMGGQPGHDSSSAPTKEAQTLHCLQPDEEGMQALCALFGNGELAGS